MPWAPRMLGRGPGPANDFRVLAEQDGGAVSWERMEKGCTWCHKYCTHNNLSRMPNEHLLNTLKPVASFLHCSWPQPLSGFSSMSQPVASAGTSSVNIIL